MSQKQEIEEQSPVARQTWLILGVAAALRALVIVFVLRQYAPGWFFKRGTEMSLMAKSIVEGHGLSSPFGPATGPTAMFAPLYPLLEAGLFRMFGVETPAAAVALMTIHLIANLLTIWLMMRVAREALNERVARVAGWIWALSVPLWFLPTILWDTSMTICLLMGLMALALKMRRRPGAWAWAGLGAYCGLTAMVNPALMLVVMGTVAVTAWGTARDGRLRVGHLVLGLVMFTLVFSAWPVRNARVFHAFVPLRTALGLDVWMGNHEGSSGYLEERLFPTFNAAELRAYEEQGEIAYTAGKMKLAERWMAQNPGRFAALTARRFARFWLGTGTQGGSWIFPLQAVVTTGVGAWGLVLMARRRRELALLLSVPLILFPIPYYLSHAEFRFRLVIEPVMTLLAAYALVGKREDDEVAAP